MIWLVYHLRAFRSCHNFSLPVSFRAPVIAKEATPSDFSPMKPGPRTAKRLMDGNAISPATRATARPLKIRRSKITLAPLLDDTVTVKVPSGTQLDSVLRPSGRGLPKFRVCGHGSLLVRPSVHVPEKLTAKERKLFEQLREIRWRDG